MNHDADTLREHGAMAERLSLVEDVLRDLRSQSDNGPEHPGERRNAVDHAFSDRESQ